MQGLADEVSDHLEAQLKTIVHRGPDGNRCHIEREKGLAMGHVRLSINDLEGGQQPLHCQDQRLSLIHI